MVTACPKCNTKYKISDDKIKPGGSRFKCKKCGEIMLVKLSAAQLKARAGIPVDTPSKAQGGQMPPQQPPPGQAGYEQQIPPQPPPEVPPMYQRLINSYPQQEKKDDPRSFIDRLPEALGYPFHGNGIWMLAVGTPFFWLLLLMSKYFILGFLIGLFVAGYLIAFMMKIVSYSADGEDEVPNWPEISDFWDAVLGPIGKMLGILFFSFAPALIYFYLVRSTDLIFLSLCAMALLYIPMALIAVSMSGSIMNINPVLVISSIFKMPGDYLLASIVLFFLVGIRYATILVTSHIPIAGSLIDTFLMLYFLMLEMRILGLLYYTNRKLFGWYDVE